MNYKRCKKEGAKAKSRGKWHNTKDHNMNTIVLPKLLDPQMLPQSNKLIFFSLYTSWALATVFRFCALI